MADTITLTGRLANITSKPVEDITRVTVKAPVARPGGDIITTRPVDVSFDPEGNFTVGVVAGVGWLYIEGDSWSDSIKFVATNGMKYFWEAAVNAMGLPTNWLDFFDLRATLAGELEDTIRSLGLTTNVAGHAPNGTEEGAGRILRLDENGKLVIRTESITQPENPANKEYVDASVWTLPADFAGNADNLNTPDSRGAYDLHNTATGLPFSAYGVLEVFPLGKGVMQRAFDQSRSHTWVRRTNSGVFSDWERLIDYRDYDNLLGAIGRSKWTRDGMFQGNADELITSVYAGVYDLHNTATGLPFSAYGVLEVFPLGKGVMQRAFDQSRSHTWVRRTNSGVFSDWERLIDYRDYDNLLGAISDVKALAETKANPSPLTSGFTRRIPVSLNVATSSYAQQYTEGAFRILFGFNAPALRWRFIIANENPKTGSTRGPWSLSEVILADHTTEFGTTNPKTIMAREKTFGDGEDYVSPWMTDPIDTDKIIQYRFRAENSGTLEGATAKLNEEDGTWSRNTGTPLWVWLEIETYAETPTVAIIGDSTGIGSGATLPVRESALAIVGRKQGFFPVFYGASGHRMRQYSNPEDYTYRKWRHINQVDSVVIEVGSNDIHNDEVSLDILQARFLQLVNTVRAMSKDVYAMTIKPRKPPHPTQEAVRVEYNEWLKTLPGDINGVIDSAEKVAPGGVVPDEWDRDGAHVTTQGHEAIASAFTFPICSPRVEHTWEP